MLPLAPIFGAGFMGGSGASFVPDLSGGAAAPSSAASGIGGVSLGFDNSNWTVATGSASASATNAKNDPTAALAQAIPWTVLALAAFAAVLVWKLA